VDGLAEMDAVASDLAKVLDKAPLGPNRP
jgi:hypothetical protein